MPARKLLRTVRGAELRAALLDRVRKAIAANELEALSARMIGRDLELSHQGPFVHFPGGLREMIEAIAAEEFGRLGYALKAIRTPSRAGITSRILTYIRFGVENPLLYREMFGESLDGVPAGTRPGRRPAHPRGPRGGGSRGEIYRLLTEFVLMPRSGSTRLEAGAAALLVVGLADGLVRTLTGQGLSAVAEPERWSPDLEARLRTLLDAALGPAVGSTGPSVEPTEDPSALVAEATTPATDSQEADCDSGDDVPQPPAQLTFLG
jgi:hypothetical protein